ncbi:MAG: hypothetical protein H7268_02305 [Sandarakinorhabdus sp.]|nr:hypothetical protein [Sandarakinorhabdus sp.]
MMLVAAVAGALAVAALLPGTYTNEEQVYFAREAGKPVPPWTGIRITPDAGGYRMQAVDAFGVATGDDQMMRLREDDRIVSIRTGACIRDYARVPLGLTIVNQSGRCTGPPGTTTVTMAGMAMKLGDGTVLELQRARAFKCWVSIPRRAKKPDGSDDWWFKSGLVLHDAGGRVTATTDEMPSQAFTLRMRNVAWPSGRNAPSLVLYVHGADPDHAISYAWADPAAKRVGINLQFMQGSCSLVEP